MDDTIQNSEWPWGAVLLCIQKDMEGVLYSLETPEVIRCVLLYVLETVEHVRYALELLEVIHCVMEVVEVMLYALEVLEGSELCAALYAGDRGSRTRRTGAAEGNAICAEIARGCVL